MNRISYIKIEYLYPQFQSSCLFGFVQVLSTVLAMMKKQIWFQFSGKQNLLAAPGIFIEPNVIYELSWPIGGCISSINNTKQSTLNCYFDMPYPCMLSSYLLKLSDIHKHINHQITYNQNTAINIRQVDNAKNTIQKQLQNSKL